MLYGLGISWKYHFPNFFVKGIDKIFDVSAEFKFKNLTFMKIKTYCIYTYAHLGSSLKSFKNLAKPSFIFRKIRNFESTVMFHLQQGSTRHRGIINILKWNFKPSLSFNEVRHGWNFQSLEWWVVEELLWA
jgi:hypothetical protein